MNKKICVIGMGTVGKATMKTFDIASYYSRSSRNIEFEDIVKCDFIFICLPTPVDKKGNYYTIDIRDIIRRLAEYYETNNSTIVIRSTVYPGFNRFISEHFGLRNIVSNPEFLSEDTWERDALQPQLVVIGADNPEYRERLKGLYQGRFKYNEPVITDSITAELLKLSLNGFFTNKIVYANAIYDYAQKVKANYETIRFVLENHPWGSKGHFQVFHKGGRGAAGKCLRKDINALAHYADTPFLHAVFYNNEKLLEESNKV